MGGDHPPKDRFHAVTDMGIFKLPVISIGGRRGDGGSGSPKPGQGFPPQRKADGGMMGGVPQHGEGHGIPEEVPAAPRISIDIPRGQVPSVSRPRRDDAQRGGASGKVHGTYTDVPTMFLDNAKEVIARCIQAGIIGDSAARDYFRTYSAYLEREPSGGYEDLLSFAFKNNEEQFVQIASILNSSLDYPLARLEVDPSRIAGGLNGILEGDLLSLSSRIRVPVLTASTSDLLVLGVANPYLARHAEAAMRAEIPGQENSYRFYLLLSPDQLRTALGRMGSGTDKGGEAVSVVAGDVEDNAVAVGKDRDGDGGEERGGVISP